MLKQLMIAPLTATALCIFASAADSQFVRPEQSDEQASTGPCDLHFPSNVPVRCWQGLQIFVLPQTIMLRSYGYQTFDGGTGEYGHASYNDLAGKTLTVTRVEPVADILDGTMKNYRLTVREDKTGAEYTTRTVNIGRTPDDAMVSNVVLLRDLVEARSRYVGKTYWIALKQLPKLGMSDVYGGDGFVDFMKFSPVTITDVLASTEDDKPVRIVVKNGGGEEGYFDIAASPTNRTAIGEVGDAALEGCLDFANPKLSHKWSPKVWEAIQHARVFAGMSEDMARMSWGKPISVNRTIAAGRVHEQWVYESNSYLYFDDGVLSAIQN